MLKREEKRINTVSSRSGPIKNLKKDTGTGWGGGGVNGRGKREI